jgi:hypothetical protein
VKAAMMAAQQPKDLSQINSQALRSKQPTAKPCSIAQTHTAPHF